MHSNHLMLEEPIRMATILEPSKASFFPAMTKIVGTLGPHSRSVDVISFCLKTGMSGQEATSEVLPINFAGLAKVAEVKGDVVCVIKNSATLAGSLFTLHASQIRIDLPTLSEKDKSGAITECLTCSFMSHDSGEDVLNDLLMNLAVDS